jgi:hypothetical protein
VLDSDEEESAVVERASETMLKTKAGSTGATSDKSGLEANMVHPLEMSQHDNDLHDEYDSNNDGSQSLDDDERSYQPDEDDETEDEDSVHDSVDSNSDAEVEVIAEILEDTDPWR